MYRYVLPGKVKNLDGSDADADLAKVVAVHLSRLTRVDDPLKVDSIARSLYAEGSVLLDDSDKERLREWIKSTELPVAITGQAIRALNDAPSVSRPSAKD